MLLTTLKRYNILGKVTAITTDNALNNDTMFKAIAAAIETAYNKIALAVLHDIVALVQF